MIEQDLEEVYVTGSHGTVWRAIEVFKIGEMQGTHNERLRIINLLTEMQCGHYCRCMNNELCEVYAEAIALIKGEQK